MPRSLEGALTASGRSFAIVASRFNDLVVKALVEGATDALVRHGADPDGIVIAWAPGAFEIPVVTKALLERQPGLSGVVAVGCVIRGETAHFEHVTGPVSAALSNLALESGKPVGMGILATDTLEQAMQRAGAKAGNKGWEAAMAVLETADLLARVALAQPQSLSSSR